MSRKNNWSIVPFVDSTTGETFKVRMRLKFDLSPKQIDRLRNNEQLNLKGLFVDELQLERYIK